MILFSICDIPWWLLWLLPLLLALLTWWYWNNKYNKMVDEYEGKIKGLNGRISGLEEDLAACKSKRSELESDLALTKGRMREMEADMQKMKESGGGGNGKNEAIAAGLGAIAGSLTGGGSDDGSSGIAATSDGGGAKSIYAGVKADNLQIIEGIGPKMESVLKENGIDSHATLGSKSVDDLQAILDKYGDKYKIIDPKTWPSQAKLAGGGQFDELIDYQTNWILEETMLLD